MSMLILVLTYIFFSSPIHVIQFYTISKVLGVSEENRRIIDISNKRCYKNFIADKKIRIKVLNIVARKTIIVVAK